MPRKSFIIVLLLTLALAAVPVPGGRGNQDWSVLIL
jgi:hypothetical protein